MCIYFGPFAELSDAVDPAGVADEEVADIYLISFPVC
jgi:hypothetical protein